MSKYIDEIIEDINNNPTAWQKHKLVEHNRLTYEGIRKGNIFIAHLGNGVGKFAFFSMARVVRIGFTTFGNYWLPCTDKDSRKLEVAVNNWFMTMDLKTIMK